jgi:hypothetical protein
MKTLSQQVRAIIGAGFRYHEFGSLKKDGKKVATYYKGDTLTPEIRAAIQKAAPEAYFLNTSPQYAPEIVRPIVCFPVSPR